LAAEDYGSVGGVEVEMIGSLSLLLTIVTDEYLDRGETLSV
jgi:hypothetical protein